MKRTRTFLVGGAFLTLLVALGVGQALLARAPRSSRALSKRPASKSIRSGPNRFPIIGCSETPSASG
jgi:hypothetical protein